MSAPRALLDFTEDGGLPPLKLAFERPLAVLCAQHPDEVHDVLRAVERHASQGAWCVGYVSYEAAMAFDPAFGVHAPDGPLAWFGVFDDAQEWPQARPAFHATATAWDDPLCRAEFDARVERIHEAIRAGEAYQINLTSSTTRSIQENAEAWFHALHRCQPASYAAFIDTGEAQILSVSPELFFDWRDGRILCRPMKGTAPRGRTPQEDRAVRQYLTSTEKERAENLMIVDLIRNDLSRIARPFSVKVPKLFDTRAWPTVWQMTSDVVAMPRDGVGLLDVFRALFPCGSVTGVPKVRATHLIRTLEDGPRGIYCGALGVVRPGGAATFNVPIRTIEIRQGRARCGTGSGITIDARAEGEWDEWHNKRRFIHRASDPFDLIETLRLQDGRYRNLSAHLQRLHKSVAYFGFALPSGSITCELNDIARKHPSGTWRLRLAVSASGSVETRVESLCRQMTVQHVRLAACASDTVHADFLEHKTSRRDHYDRFTCDAAEVFDVLMWNDRGEITEFTRGNVVAKLDGRWITPPAAAGLLPGVMRERLLHRGIVCEAPLQKDDLPHVERLVFVNSLRGCLPVRLCPPADAAYS